MSELYVEDYIESGYHCKIRFVSFSEPNMGHYCAYVRLKDVSKMSNISKENHEYIHDRIGGHGVTWQDANGWIGIDFGHHGQICMFDGKIYDFGRSDYTNNFYSLADVKKVVIDMVEDAKRWEENAKVL